eukprot:1348091-Pyramimonas_sp.AAC.1
MSGPERDQPSQPGAAEMRPSPSRPGNSQPARGARPCSSSQSTKASCPLTIRAHEQKTRSN